MKLFILFLFACLCYTNGSANFEWYLKQMAVSGISKVMNVMMKCQLETNKKLNVSAINVHFYDFRNEIYGSYDIDQAARKILSINNFNKRNKFFIYVGGFKSNIGQDTMVKVKDAFRNITHLISNYLIIVDHSAYTNDKDRKPQKSYDRSVKYVPSIGKKLANMLADLYKGGVSATNMHCIGHSLGGQILGYAGENFSNLIKNQKIQRITALDPAKPCFVKKTDKVHIRSGVATYVEIYHCNSPLLGSELSLGDVDFFINDGNSQPGCETKSFVDAAECSHTFCARIWIDSVLNKYQAYKCNKFDNFINRKCSRNHETTAGFWNPGSATGTYYFATSHSKFYT